MHRLSSRIGTAVLLLFMSLACRYESGTTERNSPNVAGASAAVDSALPMAVLMDHFRRGLDQPRALRSEVRRRDDLVQRVVDALSRSDTVAFERLAVTRAEWAWLYYPFSPIARPPYELPPALAWFQLQERNRRGVFRALREFGGHKVHLTGYRCAARPAVVGPNRIWSECIVRLSRDGAPPVALRLFGAILERDSSYAILSYANDF